MDSIFLKCFLLFCILFDDIHTIGVPCILRPYETGMVCVCNASYCDTLEFELPKHNGSIVIVSSSEQGLRFDVNEDNFSNPNRLEVLDKNNYKIFRKSNKVHQRKHRQAKPSIIDSRSIISWFLGQSMENTTLPNVKIIINHENQHQKIVGFGGALTGSVAHLFDTMDPDLKSHLYFSYFSKDKGLGYSLIRTSIGGCDFDLTPWAYNEFPLNDKSLSNFTKLDDRDLLKIRQLREIKTKTLNTDIKIMAAAWSPPKWMKTNNQWTGLSALKSEYYSTWADYHIKFIELMHEKNMSIWAISTGNEPMNGAIFWMFVRFMSLGWNPREQGRWVSKYLGPKLRQSKYNDILLFAGDDQRYTFPWWFNEMKYDHPDALDYVDGFAVHWYWDSFIPPTSTIDKTRDEYSNKLILNTESCLGDKPYEHHGPVLGSWARALIYAMNIFQDLKHSVNGWIDWNLVLNEQGGPNYAKNHVSAPIIVNSTTKGEAYKQPIFYVLGHFSRFITPDSVRIDASSSDSNVRVLAFERPDHLTTVIIFNTHKLPVSVQIEDNQRGAKEILLPPHSIHSILYL